MNFYKKKKLTYLRFLVRARRHFLNLYGDFHPSRVFSPINEGGYSHSIINILVVRLYNC